MNTTQNGRKSCKIITNAVGKHGANKGNQDVRFLEIIPMYVMHRDLPIQIKMADVTVGYQARLAGEYVGNIVQIVVRVLEARPFAGGVAWTRRKMHNRDAREMRLQRPRK